MRNPQQQKRKHTGAAYSLEKNDRIHLFRNSITAIFFCKLVGGQLFDRTLYRLVLRVRQTNGWYQHQHSRKKAHKNIFQN